MLMASVSSQSSLLLARASNTPTVPSVRSRTSSFSGRYSVCFSNKIQRPTSFAFDLGASFLVSCPLDRRLNLSVPRAAPGSDFVPENGELSSEEIEVGGSGEDLGGGGGGGDSRSNGGGGGGSEGEEGEGKESENSKKSMAMSMSQKLTLGYAALVGAGGIMGFMKSGSQKSLASGGLSALLLVLVYNELPVRPAFASSLGLGLSAALLAVMGSRFMRSKKLFPAGIVSFVSFIMAGGYLHGLLCSAG